jgi:microcystin-dependent protein
MDPYIGEIRLFAFPSIIPGGWLVCDGSILPVASHQALFALLGVAYGGDGRTTFGLPDLRGRVPVHRDPRSSAYPGSQGTKAGTETVALSAANMPLHSHSLNADSGTANSKASPVGAFPASGGTSGQLLYSAPANLVTLDPATVGLSAGTGTAHENMQPFLTLQYCIAAVGLFPSRQ